MTVSDYTFLKRLAKRQETLTKEIAKREKRLKKAPDGNLKIIKNRENYQYYQRQKGEPMGKYIKKENEKLITALAQKRYDEKYIAVAKEEVKNIKAFLDKYQKKTSLISAEFPWEIKNKIDIAEMTYDEYALCWQNIVYQPKKIDDGVPFHVTKRGERVRSKSEELIANLLYANGIAYRYECPVRIFNGELRYPDFTILNPQTGKVVFWEHLGMVDNAEYVEKNLKKFRDYEKTGIFLGEELLVTVETQQMPLNSKGIEAFICKHFGKN